MMSKKQTQHTNLRLLALVLCHSFPLLRCLNLILKEGYTGLKGMVVDRMCHQSFCRIKKEEKGIVLISSSL